MQTNPMHSLSRELAAELVGILTEPSYIYVDKLEPDAERLPVPRYLIRALIEALDLANQQLTTYRKMSGDLAALCREMLAQDASNARLPIVQKAQDTLRKVEDFNAG